jgi:hypothetical protein
MTTQNNYDESVRQDGGSIHNSAKAENHDKSVSVLIALLAAAVAGTLVMDTFLYEKWRDAEMESRLHQYNLDWFKSHEFAEVKNKLDLQDKMSLVQTQCRR